MELSAGCNQGDQAKLIVAMETAYRMGVHVGSVGVRVVSGKVCVGSTGLFGYQHVGISNMKWSHWGSKPTRPNASGFALQWNIGCIVFYHF